MIKNLYKNFAIVTWLKRKNNKNNIKKIMIVFIFIDMWLWFFFIILFLSKKLLFILKWIQKVKNLQFNNSLKEKYQHKYINQYKKNPFNHNKLVEK